MNLPATVRVGSLTYQVICDGVADANHNYGETNPIEQKIRLGALVTPERLAETLLHEIIHAVNLDRSTQLKESQVRNLANGLCALLQDMGYWPREVEK